jgi:hypothetical protein
MISSPTEALPAKAVSAEHQKSVWKRTAEMETGLRAWSKTGIGGILEVVRGIEAAPEVSSIFGLTNYTGRALAAWEQDEQDHEHHVSDCKGSETGRAPSGFFSTYRNSIRFAPIRSTSVGNGCCTAGAKARRSDTSPTPAIAQSFTMETSPLLQ